MSTILGNGISIRGGNSRAGGAKIATTLNEDGTQNIYISDDAETVIDLKSLTKDATATAEDVASGKTFYAQGTKYTGTGAGNPVLLWSQTYTNGMSWGAQTVSISGTGYDAYLVELTFGRINNDTSYNTATNIHYLPFGEWAGDKNTSKMLGVGTITSGSSWCSNARSILKCSTEGIQFARGMSGYSGVSDYCAIPTRIWGIKFTLE